MASVSVVPSKWPEAFGMVAVEAMAAGVLPLCNYHAGLRDVVDEVANTMPDVSQLMTLNRESFAADLPAKVEAALAYLYPEGFDRHRHRREVGRRLREVSVGPLLLGGNRSTAAALATAIRRRPCPATL